MSQPTTEVTQTPETQTEVTETVTPVKNESNNSELTDVNPSTKVEETTESMEEKEQSPEPSPEPPKVRDNRVVNVPNWLKENESNFKPPICNKLMFGGQLKIMFVGGPNVRKDFHIDCGEEFFFQIKGNIQLPIYERGSERVIDIREGDVFLLPGCIPHSPQRPEDGSIGLVIERERVRPEMDALRYYDSNKKPLWEKWFYCHNLGTQLVPIVNEYKESIECKTQETNENSICTNPPVILDTETVVNKPFNIFEFIHKNKTTFLKEKELSVCSGDQTQVNLYCGPLRLKSVFELETWIYVLRGNVTVGFNHFFNSERRQNPKVLESGDCLIVYPNSQYSLMINDDQSQILTVTMRPPKGGYTRMNNYAMQENLKIHYIFDGWPKPITLEASHYIGFYKTEEMKRYVKLDDLRHHICQSLNEENLEFAELRVGIKDFNDTKPNWTKLEHRREYNRLELSYSMDGCSEIYLWFKTQSMIDKNGGRPFPTITQSNETVTTETVGTIES